MGRGGFFPDDVVRVGFCDPLVVHEADQLIEDLCQAVQGWIIGSDENRVRQFSAALALALLPFVDSTEWLADPLPALDAIARGVPPISSLASSIDLARGSLAAAIDTPYARPIDRCLHNLLLFDRERLPETAAAAIQLLRQA